MNNYKTLVDFIGGFLGDNAVVFFYDVKQKEIKYGHNINQARIGQEIIGVEGKIIKEKLYIENDYLLNYRTLNENGQKIRAATYFIKDDEGNLEGLIVVYYIVDQLIELRETLNEIISGSPQEKEAPIEYYESHDISFEDMMMNTIEETVQKYPISPKRFSVEEKMKLLKELDSKGVFLIKGSIKVVANIFGSSEASIYRYLNNL